MKSCAETGKKCTSPSWKWLAAALALAALLQMVTFARTSVIQPDGITFIRIAQNIRGSFVTAARTADQHSGYPLLILAAKTLNPVVRGNGLNAWIFAARLAVAPFWLLTIVAVWLLARRLFDARVAGVAAVFSAMLPLFRDSAADTMSDMPHLLFYVLAVWLACEGLAHRRWVWFALAGSSSAVAYWIRPEGLGVAVVTAGFLVALALRKQSRRFALAGCAAVVVAAVAVGAPYAVIKGSLTSKKDPAWLMKLDGADARAPAQRYAGPQPLQATMFPVTMARAVAEMLQRFVQTMRYFLLLPLVLGLFAPTGLRAQHQPRQLVLAVAAFHVLLLFILYQIAHYINERHIMELVVFCLPWTAAGTLYLARLIAKAAAQRQRLRWVSEGMAAVVLVAVPAAGLFPRDIRPLHYHKIALVQAARWIGAEAAPQDQIITNSFCVPFYAERRAAVLLGAATLPIPCGESAVGPYRYVLFDVKESSFRPEWRQTLETYYERVSLPEKGPGASRVLLMKAR